MEDIATAVGIQKPTLYHYFKRKDEILFTIHESVMNVILQRHEGRVGTSMPASHQLLEIIADILELNETHPGHARPFFENFSELTVEQQEVVRSKRDHYFLIVKNAVRGGVENGEFREVDPDYIALAILGACNWSYQWFRPQGRARSREIAYSFWDMTMRGLRVS
jgi:AcrR family transcriptional regulator